MPMLLQRQTRGVAFGNACGDDGGNDYDYGLVCVVDDSVATSTTTAPPDAASSIASPLGILSHPSESMRRCYYYGACRSCKRFRQ